jgi:type II secretory pathway component GspD/PulD (secretin)
MIESLLTSAIAIAIQTMNVPFAPAGKVNVHKKGQQLTVCRGIRTIGIDPMQKADFFKHVAMPRTALAPNITSLLTPSFTNSVLTVSPAQNEQIELTPIKGQTTCRVDEGSSERIGNSSNFDSSLMSGDEYIEALLTPKVPVSEAITAQKGHSFAELPFAPANKTVTLVLSSTPLETVVSLIGKQVGVNIVLLSQADQKVTINVKDMYLLEALQHLSAVSGLRLLKVKNTLVMAEDSVLKTAYPKEYERDFGTTSKPNSDPTSSGKEPAGAAPRDINRVVNTKFQSASQLVLALKDYLEKKKVSIVALPNTMVPTIDAQSGAQGTSTSITSGALTSDRGNNETGSRKILLSGPKQEVEDVIDMIREMDVPRKQVEITVTIHDVSNEALKEVGLAWDFGQFTVSESNSNSINFGTFNRTGVSFQATMKSLEKNDRAKLLASPNVSVMDGLRAFILIGEKRQFPIVNGTTPTGQFIFSTQEQNIGIYLQVAADITDDGTITMAVKPQVSAIIGFLQLNGGSYPQISTRESQSHLTLKDGQTMLLGGLLRDEEVKNMEQVPFLSKIPFFGELFKSRRTQKRSSQLLISITPKIVKQ